MLLVTVAGFGLQFYVLKHLPVVDCLPFKKGNNISEKMKMPANAIPDSVVMTFVYEKEGNKVEFTADKFPDDFNDSLYTFIDRYDKLVRKGKNNEPPIKGFSLSGITNIDSTGIILTMPYTLILFEEKPTENIDNWEEQFFSIDDAAGKNNIPLFIVTTSIDEFLLKRKGELRWTEKPILKCDFTAIRSAARANPTLYLLKNGTIKGKWSYADFGKAYEEIKNIPVQPSLPITDTLVRVDSPGKENVPEKN